MSQDRGQHYNPFRTKSEEEAGWDNPFLTTDVKHQYQPQYQPSLSSEDEWMNPSFGGGGGGTLWKNSLLSEPSTWDSPKLVDTSLESDSDWSPERGGASMFLSRPSPDRSAAASSLTPSAASSYIHHSSSSSIINSARMMLEERLSILFDGVSSEPSCRIVGRLHVIKDMELPPPERFYVTIRDPRQQVQEWHRHLTHCDEATTLANRGNDRSFRIDTRLIQEQSSVLEYICTPKSKLFPLLLKTKLHTDDLRCRLAVRIRANPSNTHTLHRITLLVFVPPNVKGEQVQIGGAGSVNGDDHNHTNTNDGGVVWDAMKRTLAYSYETLAPGDTVDWQAIFPRPKDDSNNNEMDTILFPILLQCHGENHLFSRVEVEGQTYEHPPRSMELDMTRKTSVLFRKVS